jgi:capsid portal protein
MVDAVIEAKRKCAELKAKRNLLFERYLKHPMETQLALEIKIIDDQIAEHTKQMERKTGKGS